MYNWSFFMPNIIKLQVTQNWTDLCPDDFPLTHLVLRQQFSQRTRSIPWLLMPWLLASPGHQQPWYWLHETGTSLSSWGANLNNMDISTTLQWHHMSCISNHCQPNCLFNSLFGLETCIKKHFTGPMCGNQLLTYWPFVRGIHWPPVDSPIPTKGQ